ncbi:MAG TPA: universal stress protein [Candidatus Limnocylindrales bacterium]|nr:universal stress protein [Candidatus Limnocylindrales bacterium]
MTAALRLAGPTAEPAPIRRILLATDLSDASVPATERALELAAGLRAALVIVSVIDPSTTSGSRVDQVRREREDAMTNLVTRARGRLIPTEYLIWTGDPGDSIVEAATAEAADLVVVGSRGRSGIERALLGSVSDHVVRHAACPVMVVRGRPDRGAG